MMLQLDYELAYNILDTQFRANNEPALPLSSPPPTHLLIDYHSQKPNFGLLSTHPSIVINHPNPPSCPEQETGKPSSQHE